MKLPDRIFGIDTREAYQRYLEESQAKPKEKQEEPKNEFKPIPSNIQNPKSYIILPEGKHGSYFYPEILVSTELSHKNRTWEQAHNNLNQEDSFMLNIRQYVDFLNLLRTGKAYDGRGRLIQKQKLDSLLDEIIEVRNPARGEWLDSKFSASSYLNGIRIYVTYHKINSNGALEEVTEPLEDCLMSDKTPGISLDYWLKNATKHGIPPRNTEDGNLYYYHPRNGTVARFVADSVGAGLCCDRDPWGSGSWLGVRPAREKK